MKRESDKELKQLNTFGISAKASSYIELDNEEDAKNLFKKGDWDKSNLLILGGGSNILLRSKYFDGLVIRNNIKGKKILKENDEHIWLEVGAGENWHQFVLYCIENEYAGIENLSLIPGNVGASPMQNIGAYGVEVKEVIEEVKCVSRKDGSVVTFSNSECQFDYRSSIFKTTHRDLYLITSVTFRLNKKPTFNVSYGAIQNQLIEDGVQPEELSIGAISNAVIKIRRSKLPDPKEIGNSGSFFKNPVVSKSVYLKLKSVFNDMPAYQLLDGNYKLAAGWLIEKAEWKGYREGDFGVHQKQALVLVNYGNASGEDIYQLSERILNSVRQKFGVELEREVNVI